MGIVGSSASVHSYLSTSGRTACLASTVRPSHIKTVPKLVSLHHNTQSPPQVPILLPPVSGGGEADHRPLFLPALPGRGGDSDYYSIISMISEISKPVI